MIQYNRIKIVLAEKRRTSKELAKHLKVEAATVSRWCQNRSQPDISTLYEIADFLEVPVEILLIANRFGRVLVTFMGKSI